MYGEQRQTLRIQTEGKTMNELIKDVRKVK